MSEGWLASEQRIGLHVLRSSVCRNLCALLWRAKESLCLSLRLTRNSRVVAFQMHYELFECFVGPRCSLRSVFHHTRKGFWVRTEEDRCCRS